MTILVRKNATVATLVGLAAVSSLLPGAGFFVSALSAGTAIALLVGNEGILENVDDLLDACFETDAELFERAIASTQGSVRVRPLATAQVIGFINGEAKAFEVKEVARAADSVAGPLDGAFTTLRNIAGRIPVLPRSVTQTLPRLTLTREQTLNPSTMSISGVSRGDISGSSSVSGGYLVLKFTAADNAPNGNLDFSFNLNRSNQPAKSVSGRLMVAKPEADDASITVRQGTATNSNVQARGATSLEIVDRPRNGTVVLNNSGSFTYTPAGQFFGSDSFTYRARSAQGVSNTATVLISVIRQFEGAWAVTAVSTTTTESTPGLCPNETNNISLNISKISDTLYSANYLGEPIPLSMGSKDDPAGLTGSLSGTYPDDPGETTESLSVRVPNSTQLEGSSQWSYRGPNGSSCTGRTVVTGRRP